MTDTANLGLPCIEGSQAQKHVTHNEALRILDTLVQLAVLDRDLTAPPGSPAGGERWIVKSGASGAWAGHDDAIAAWQDGAWQFCTPQTGWLAYVVDEGALLAWSGSAWVDALSVLTSLNNMTLLGVGTTADTTNPLSARLNNTLFTARTVAEGGDGDLRCKMSKEAAANTLSLLFQNNYSGRAEIGLTGDDDFRFKVSPDGTTWYEGIVIDKDSGAVTFPNTSIGGTGDDIDLTLAELSLGVADALNTAQFLGASGNRFADSFDTLACVDTGSAANLDTGTAGVLKPVAGADLGPTMTGASTPSPYAASASGSSDVGGAGGNAPWTAFDNNTTTAVSGWYSNPGNGAWLKLDFGSAVTVGAYRVYNRYDSNANLPTGWVLKGSDDDAAYTAVDTRSSLTWSGNGTYQAFALSSPQTYRYWKLDAITAADDVMINELRFLGATANLTVTSTALTAASAPSSAKLVARVKEIDSLTLNTDLVFSVSRDGGTTYTAFAMTRKFTASSIAVYQSDQLDISGQPGGTSMKWKAESANNRNFELHDVCLYWS